MAFELSFSLSACMACQTCVVACMDWNQALEIGPLFEIESVETGSWRADGGGRWLNDVSVSQVVKICTHCTDAPCMAACGRQAIMRDEDTGVVWIDGSSCAGCGQDAACAGACGNGAVFVHAGNPRPLKCDGCLVRIRAGFNPICVDACPTRCISWGL